MAANTASKASNKVTRKWNGQPCPLCGEGTLHDGVKNHFAEVQRQGFHIHRARRVLQPLR